MQKRKVINEKIVVSLCDITLIVIGISYILFAWFSVEFGLSYVHICPFCLLTSMPCPLCGMTRAFGQLLHGNIDHAIQFHPLAIPLLVMWVGFIAYSFIVFFRDVRFMIRIRQRLQKQNPLLAGLHPPTFRR